MDASTKSLEEEQTTNQTAQKEEDEDVNDDDDLCTNLYQMQINDVASDLDESMCYEATSKPIEDFYVDETDCSDVSLVECVQLTTSCIPKQLVSTDEESLVEAYETSLAAFKKIIPSDIPKELQESSQTIPKDILSLNVDKSTKDTAEVKASDNEAVVESYTNKSLLTLSPPVNDKSLRKTLHTNSPAIIQYTPASITNDEHISLANELMLNAESLPELKKADISIIEINDSDSDFEASEDGIGNNDAVKQQTTNNDSEILANNNNNINLCCPPTNQFQLCNNINTIESIEISDSDSNFEASEEHGNVVIPIESIEITDSDSDFETTEEYGNVEAVKKQIANNDNENLANNNKTNQCCPPPNQFQLPNNVKTTLLSLDKSPCNNTTGTDIFVEDFTAFQQNIARINLDSTPKYIEQTDTSNTSEDNSKSKDNSIIVTRRGRFIKKRLDVSLTCNEQDGDDNSDVGSDEDYTLPVASVQHNNKSKSFNQHELVYLDLRVPLVKDFKLAPDNHTQVDKDSGFQQRLNAFVGNEKKRRKLYTPLYDEHMNIECQEPTTNKSNNTSFLNVSKERFVNTTTTTATATTTQQTTPEPLLPNIGISLINKNIQDINAAAAASTPRRMKAFQYKLPIHDQVACKLRHKHIQNMLQVEPAKYNFFQSLDVKSVPEQMCHSSALKYRHKFFEERKKLAKIIYDIFNHTIFNCALNIPILWNKKVTQLSNCCNTTNRNGKHSYIEFSETLVSNAKILCSALLHEICHAAAWMYEGEFGHGVICSEWLERAKELIPDLPRIYDCGRPAHKYRYSCMLCDLKSQGSITLKQEDNLRCYNCLFSIEIQSYQTEKDIPDVQMFTAKKEYSGFAKYVKENYKKIKNDNISHFEIMQILSAQYK